MRLMEEEIKKTLSCPRIVRGQQDLTPEQQTFLSHFVKARIAVMLSTTVVDEEEAEAWLRQAYQVAGFPPPQRIRWFDSPQAFVPALLSPRGMRLSGDPGLTVRRTGQAFAAERLGSDLYIKLNRRVIQQLTNDYPHDLAALNAFVANTLPESLDPH
jgi:hypothetical protein